MEMHRRDVDRLYKDLPDMAPDLWLVQPNYDRDVHYRRAPDELPPDVTDYMNRVEALKRLAERSGQQVNAFKLVVMGLVRSYRNGEWQDVRCKRMTYGEAADCLGVSENAVGHLLSRARENLAEILEDEE